MRTTDGQPALNGLRVMIVEDDAILAMALEMALSEMGCDVVCMASNVQDGIALARDAVVDGAILDVNLAGEMIYPVADVLAARGIPFAFTTGYGAAALRDGDHARPVLQKPYRIEALAQIAERWRPPTRNQP